MKRAVLPLTLLVLLALTACGQRATGGSQTPTASASATALPSTATPSPSPTPSPTPSPRPSPTPRPSTPGPPAGFTTTGVSGGSATILATVTAARVGNHEGYDRFVVEFTGGVPSYTVSIQPGTRFTKSPQGGTVALAGDNGVLLTMQRINWTAYSGPTGFQPGFPCLRQAMLIQNFEGTQQWALGVAGSPAIRVFSLDAPFRLVIDVTAH